MMLPSAVRDAAGAAHETLQTPPDEVAVNDLRGRGETGRPARVRWRGAVALTGHVVRCHGLGTVDDGVGESTSGWCLFPHQDLLDA